MRVEFGWINWGGPVGMSQGVSILAAELASAGHEVNVAHYHESLPGARTDAEYAERMAARNPDVALFSFGTNQAVIARRIVTRFKELRPETPTMAGGVHCTLTPEEPLSWGSLDYAFVGEADGRLDALVTRLARGEDIAGEPNIACIRQGFLKRAPLAPLPDVKTQHAPYWEGIDYKDLCRRMRGIIDVVAGRGCPYRCTYCHNAGIIDLYRSDYKIPVSKIGYTRVRDAHALLAECIRYREICGDQLKAFCWGDDMAVMSKPFLQTWAEIYPKEFPNTPFALNATLNFLDEEVVSLLAQGGCNLVKFGLESGSARLRKFMRRPDYKEQTVADALERLNRHGINSRAYALVGVPTETPQELMSTFDLAAKMRIDTLRVGILYPYPGTPIYDYCVERDLIDWDLVNSVRNCYSRSVLRGFDQHMTRLLGRVLDIFPMILNARLGGVVGEAFEPLAQRGLEVSDEEWNGGLREQLLEEQQGQNLRFKASGHEFYAVPFPDRPDACFLARKRARPLVNIDDSPNLTIDAA